MNAGQISIGPGQEHARIEDALAAARPGDTLLVHPLPENKPYERVALYLTTPGVTIKGVGGAAGRVRLSGHGFDYSGRGSIPRAVVQFNKGADDCRVEGFEISGAHNESHNGAGIRINQANRVTVSDCDIHGNDMGIMSNGDGTLETAIGQRIERCRIHANGDLGDPGFNHNLYLGGTDATLVGCEIHSSLTGHNVKSRCHRLTVLGCHVHDSVNREFDLVDDVAYTAIPGSDAVLAGNIIVKSAGCPGNRNVIHFGQDGGHGHDGALYLVHNTITTPFMPVVHLSGAQSTVEFYNNIVWDGGSGRKGMALVQASQGVDVESVASGRFNGVSPGFVESASEFKRLGEALSVIPHSLRLFADPGKGDYRLWVEARDLLGSGRPPPPEIMKAVGSKILQYKSPCGVEERKDGARPDLGACEPLKEVD